MADPKSLQPKASAAHAAKTAAAAATDSDASFQELSDLEEQLAALRGTYEQYFMGVERRPPAERHRDMKRRINLLRTSSVRQTAVRFRIDTIAQRFLTYERLWNKTLQEMEAGTYTRDLFKARLHAKERAAHDKTRAPDAEASEPGKANSAVTQDAQAGIDPALVAVTKPVPAVPPGMKQAVPSAPGVPLGGAGTIPDTKLRAIYDAYVVAKKRCNEDVSKISYEQMAMTLRKQVPELMKQHKAKSVEFKVVIKDGKAVLRALPKEE